MNPDSPTYRAALRRLCENFGVPDGEPRRLRAEAWATVVAQPWVTPDVFGLAVDDCVTYCAGPMPPASEFRRMLQGAKAELEHEARAAAVVGALPAPRPVEPVDVTQPPPRYSRAEWDRNVEIGRQRQVARAGRPGGGTLVEDGA